MPGISSRSSSRRPHGSAERQALFDQLLKDLETRPPYEALTRAFADVDLDALEGELTAHLDEISK